MKTTTKLTKLLSLVLAVTLLFALNITAFAYDAPAEVKTIADISSDLTGKTVILQTNDVHGAIGRYA
ncbi:MAG: hypothetical protein IKZ97_08685, partial [Butyrivibrio sp.]|nr:hypothetical protein [Butyrivibrio sp.]